MVVGVGVSEGSQPLLCVREGGEDEPRLLLVPHFLLGDILVPYQVYRGR